MFIDSYLRSHGTNLSQLTALVKEYLNPEEPEIIYFTGSLVEGLGNFKSDIDIYLISDRDFNDRLTCDSIIIITLATCFIDVEILSFDQVNKLVERLNKFPSNEERDQRTTLAFTLPELKFLHNLRIAQPLFGEASFFELTSKVNKEALSRILFDRSIVSADSLQIDILGLIEDGDSLSARYLLGHYLGHLCSAFLSALGDTNPAEKWRVRKLNELRRADVSVPLPRRKSFDEIVDMFSNLHVQCEPNLIAVKDAFSQMLHLSRLIIPWGQSRFLSGTSLRAHSYQSVAEVNHQRITEDRQGGAEEMLFDLSINESKAVLPQLNLNCRIRYNNQDFKLSHLHSTKTFNINWLAYELLLLFNGSTTLEEAVRHLKGISPAANHEILDTIYDFKTFLQHYDFI
ncbi:MAG TPA: hypothetical protein VE732_06555 [Nitrososphaera sp.]|jgi:hypothetical protein|nr:hypothetical protein [Nitrososphaera sp.]